MTALTSALLYVVLHFGPNSSLIYDQLARRDAIDRQFLPIEFLYQISQEPLYLVLHEQKDWQRAFYLPASEPALPGERNLPGLEVPRLYLYRPFYMEKGRLKNLNTFAVDIGEGYYFALLERQFERKLRDSSFRKQAETRAGELFAEVPAAQRLQVYGSALAEFAAHLMTIVSELDRAKHRGIHLCPGEKKIPLLEHWRKAFADTPFPGTYTPDGSFEPRMTGQVLQSEDKLLAVKELLGRRRWKGDAVHDLPICAP